jgi:hypothetical protein
VQRWSEVIFLTLTVDPQGTKTGRGFAGPEQAFDVVHGRRLIAKLMERLGVERWVCVLEFHASGWPHWHLLLDRRVDIRKVREWWCGQWKIGHRIDIQEAKTRSGMASYLAGYLSKSAGVPEWVKARERVRFVSASRAVMGFARWCRMQRGESARPGRDEGRGRAVAERRTIGERVLRCGSTCVVLEERRSERGELESRRFGARLNLPLRSVVRLADHCGESVVREKTFRVLEWYCEADRWEPVPGFEGKDGSPPEGVRFSRDLRPEDGGWRPVNPTWRPGLSVVCGWRGVQITAEFLRDHLRRWVA